MEARVWLAAAALNGLLAVALLALAAHGLEGGASQAAQWIETGSRYGLIHGVALLALALHARVRSRGHLLLRLAGWGFLLGTLLFSATLYLMALSGWRALGLVVPFGGVALIGAWFLLLVQAFSQGWRAGASAGEES